MSQNNLSKWLKAIIVSIALCGVLIYAVLLPFGEKTVLLFGAAFKQYYWPWMIFLWITGIPCYAVLCYSWKIADEIGKDNSFSMKNAVSLKRISQLAAADSLLFFLVNLVFLLLGMSSPEILLLSLVVVFIGVAITVSSSVLSHLVYKAAQLQEQNDLTV